MKSCWSNLFLRKGGLKYSNDEHQSLVNGHPFPESKQSWCKLRCKNKRIDETVERLNFHIIFCGNTAKKMWLVNLKNKTGVFDECQAKNH